MKAFKRQDIEHPGARRLPPFASAGDSIEDQAAAWSDALRDGDANAGLQEAFEAWRAAHPDHDRAFADIDHAYRIARAAGGSHALDSMEEEIMRRVAGRRRRRRFLTGSAAGLAASLVIGLVFILANGGWSDLRYLSERAFYALSGDGLYRAEVGERLAVSLADGSRMTLNTNSRAVVRYRDGVRGITLVRGQALFEVARDTARPFVVTAGERRVTALGTKFDVRMSEERLQVTLIEGRVKVEGEKRPAPGAQRPAREERVQQETNNEQRSFRSDSKGRQGRNGHSPKGAAHGRAASTTILHPGQQLVAVASTEPIIRPADIQRAISWRDGQIIFENDPLSEAVAEINRYAKRHVVLADERLGDMRLSGAFNTSNTRVFVDMLTVHFPVTIVQSDDDRIVLGYNGG